MPWGEALRLAKILRADPSSMLAAADEGWDFPISREAMATLDLFDLQHASKVDPKKGRPKPHPGRPFEIEDGSRRSMGNAGNLSPAEVRALLQTLRSGEYVPPESTAAF